MAQPEKTGNGYGTTGLPSVAEMPSDGQHRRSVPITDKPHDGVAHKCCPASTGTIDPVVHVK
jgi:hypothetical protein